MGAEQVRGQAGVSSAIDEKWIIQEGMMGIRGVSLFLCALLAVPFASCSPSEEAIAAKKIEGTQTAWTVPPTFTSNPTYTYYPTYTIPPTTVKDITKIIVITETDTPTSMHSPTITPTKTRPRILAMGTGMVKAFMNQDSVKMNYFDFDAGKNVDDENADIEFTVNCGAGCWPGIFPINGAIGFIFGKEEPSYEDCAENMFDEVWYSLPYPYVCMRTSSSNISVFRITLYCSINPDESETITFQYKTWTYS